MNKIKELLGVTDHQYTQITLDAYMSYCELYASNTKELQALMANTKHWEYFKQTRKQLEKEFLIQIQGYNSLSKTDLWQHYNTITCQVSKYYSRQIVKRAKQMKIDNKIKTK